MSWSVLMIDANSDLQLHPVSKMQATLASHCHSDEEARKNRYPKSGHLTAHAPTAVHPGEFLAYAGVVKHVDGELAFAPSRIIDNEGRSKCQSQYDHEYKQYCKTSPYC